jgi:hypothetical protein
LAGGDPGGALVPVERAELVTKDMDLIAELIRDLHVEHEAAFSCPDPARVDGRVRSVTASGLTASLVRYRLPAPDPAGTRPRRARRRRSGQQRHGGRHRPPLGLGQPQPVHRGLPEAIRRPP